MKQYGPEVPIVRNALRLFPVIAAIIATTACWINVDDRTMEDLPNPGRGWETFHTLNSDSRNNRYPESTVAYYRFTWRELEPTQGNIHFDLIDSLLEQVEAEGQTLGFRIMPDCGGCEGLDLGIPQWLIDAGVGGVWYRNDAFMPDFDDPLYLANARRVIRAFGTRYNGDPRVDHVDLGFVGHWGEWHVSDAVKYGATMPTLENQQQYIDWHLGSFPDTPVIMLVGDTSDISARALAYAVQNGAGWRADCWGDYRHGWNHMEDFYPGRLEAAGVGEVWKTAPVILETCGVPSTWFLFYPGRIDEILQFAVDNHVSLLNGKSSSIPRTWVDKFREFTAQIGYRFELTSITVPPSVQAGATADVVTSWTNHGNAPVYRKYLVAIMLEPTDPAGITAGEYTFTSPVDIRSWLPGTGWQAVVTLAVAENILAGSYTIKLGLIDPATGECAIQFLSDFPSGTDGWVTMGKIVVQ